MISSSNAKAPRHSSEHEQTFVPSRYSKPDHLAATPPKPPAQTTPAYAADIRFVAHVSNRVGGGPRLRRCSWRGLFEVACANVERIDACVGR
jgi:hypothetical protein